MCDVVYRKHAVRACPLCAMLYTESILLQEVVQSIVCDVVYRKLFAVGACPLCAMLYNRKHFAVGACSLCAMLYTESTLL